MDENYIYPGKELALFHYARCWKRYFARQIKPHIKGNVLEVGAGIGNNTLLLNDGSAFTWVLLEPDKQMAGILEENVQNNHYPPNCQFIKGTINNIQQEFDTIIYIDVLEHIERDKDELAKATAKLSANGKLIILSPAYNHLYITFDKAIGHYRRYSKQTLLAAAPSETRLLSCRYYDSAGYFGLLINKLLLRHTMPSKNKILFWDRVMVPVSTIADKLFFHSFGKSIIAIWQK